MTRLTGTKEKMVKLSIAMAKAGEIPVTIRPGQPGWTDWMKWRSDNNIDLIIIDGKRIRSSFPWSRGKWGFPSKYPPQGSLDTALQEYGAGTAAKKRI